MRIFKFGLIIMCAVRCFGNANADVNQCIALDASQACTNAKADDTYSWSATCGNVKVAGVAVCIDDKGDTVCTGSNDSDRGVNLTLPYNASCQRGCYCKMIYPVVSEYWYIPENNVHTDLQTCVSICSSKCAAAMASSTATTMRQTLFGIIKAD